MKLPSQLGPAIWGALGGAIAITILGFTWFGWVGPDTAESKAAERANTAVVTALTPICVRKFKESADAAEQLKALKKIDYYWQRGSFVEEGGWATFAGMSEPNSEVARACAEALEKEKIQEAGRPSEAARP
jgi:hypothetical protein